MAEEYPVLIAGGGPVGTTLAMELASRGVASLVVETRRGVAANPRCNTINARSMEIFRRLGVADAIRTLGLPAHHNTDVVYMTRLAGDELTRYARPTPADWAAGRARGLGADWPTPEPQQFVSQMYVEPLLRDHARDRFGVSIAEGWELTGFEQDDDGVTATVRDIDSGGERVIRSAFLIGADGGASTVRRQIGARLEGVPRVGRRVSTFFRAPALKPLVERTPGWMYRFVGGCNLVAIDGDALWLAHNRVPDDADLDTWDPWPAIFDAIGERFEYELLQQARWTPRAMVANKMRDGRVLLAGDAAHIWVPMGGFGMNAGVADAAALGWMLAGVVQGWLAEPILDAFQVERAALGERVAGQAAKWISDLLPLTGGSPDDPAYRDAAGRRDRGERIRAVNVGEFDCPGLQLGYYYEGSPIIVDDGTPPPPFTLDRYIESSWPGVRAPHLWFKDGRALYDAMGDGFCLLRIGRDAPDSEEFARAATARGIPISVIDLLEDEAVEKYQGYSLVLVRPDRHIAWRGMEQPTDVEAIFDRVTGRLMRKRRVVAVTAEAMSPPDRSIIPPSRIVDAQGRSYRTELGRKVVKIGFGGDETVVLDGLDHAEGIAISADGSVLLIAELGKQRISQCRIAADGTLAGYRPFARLPGLKGVAIDAMDTVWAFRREGLIAGYDRDGRPILDINTPMGEADSCRRDDNRLVIAGGTNSSRWSAQVSLFEEGASIQSNKIQEKTRSIE